MYRRRRTLNINLDRHLIMGYPFIKNEWMEMEQAVPVVHMMRCTWNYFARGTEIHVYFFYRNNYVAIYAAKSLPSLGLSHSSVLQ